MKLGKILRDSKSTLEVEVLNNSNRLIGIHKYNKIYSSHSLTEEVIMDEDELLEIFQVTKELVKDIQ